MMMRRWHVNELYTTQRLLESHDVFVSLILSSYYSQNRDISYAARIQLFFRPREYNTRFLILRPEKLINFLQRTFTSANSRRFFLCDEEATSFYGATRAEKRFRLAARDVCQRTFADRPRSC